MKTRQVLLASGVVVMALLGTTAWGGAPMGPPMALMGEGQWGLDFEYGHEEIDLRACGTRTQTQDGGFIGAEDKIYDIRDIESDMFFGSLAYGVCDNWDLYLRVGMADAQDDIRTGPGEIQRSLDGDYGFAWGVGSRATFCRWGAWSFGGLLQVTWFDPDDSSYAGAGQRDGLDQTWTGDIEMDYWQTQVGVAAIYHMDVWSFWAGPFLQFVDGDLDIDERYTIDGEGPSGTISATTDLKQESEFGLHFGANYEMSREWNLWGEGQWSDDSWLFAFGAIFKPEEIFAGM